MIEILFITWKDRKNCENGIKKLNMKMILPWFHSKLSTFSILTESVVKPKILRNLSFHILNVVCLRNFYCLRNIYVTNLCHLWTILDNNRSEFVSFKNMAVTPVIKIILGNGRLNDRKNCENGIWKLKIKVILSS